MKVKYIFIAVTLCLSAISGIAQEGRLTGRDYRRQVVDYSLRLKMSEENKVAYSAKYKAARAGYGPALSLSANANYSLGNTITFGSMTMRDYNYSANLTLQQALYAGGAVRGKVRAADVEMQIADLGQKETLHNVLYSADLTYLALVASWEQLEILEEYSTIVKKLYDIVGERFEDGYVSKTDFLMVETRLNEAEIQKSNAKRYYLASLQSLNTLLGVSPSVEYILDTLAWRDAFKYIVGSENVQNARPDYQIASRKIDLASANVRVARSRFNPQLSLGVQGVYGTPSLNFNGIPKLYGTAFAQLSVPIFMWGERRNTVGAVKSAERSARLSLHEMDDQITGEVARAVNDMRQNYETTIVAERNLNVASKSLDLNTFSYSEGKLPILDVLQSQLAWIQSYTNMVNSSYNYMVSVADYRKVMGTIEE